METAHENWKNCSNEKMFVYFLRKVSENFFSCTETQIVPPQLRRRHTPNERTNERKNYEYADSVFFVLLSRGEREKIYSVLAAGNIEKTQLNRSTNTSSTFRVAVIQTQNLNGIHQKGIDDPRHTHFGIASSSSLQWFERA